ncbi:hypothetical protein BDV93DRAFT_611590, partial [Ceratobasidium sp. AG-I]
GHNCIRGASGSFNSRALSASNDPFCEHPRRRPAEIDTQSLTHSLLQVIAAPIARSIRTPRPHRTTSLPRGGISGLLHTYCVVR